MTERIAHDTAKYMLGHSKGHKIKIRWFGGEPLYNSKAIDIISGSLKESGVEFESTMVSNAYLFDEDMVKKAVDVWNLRHLIITIDGTEEVYNRTKAYIYREGSAYRKVLDNIESLLCAGIAVRVNLNMDAANTDDLMILSEKLGRRFNKYSNFCARAVLLVEYVGRIHSFQTEKNALESLYSLNEKLKLCGIHDRKTVDAGIVLNSCMADDVNTTTILPDGRLGRCEHFGDSEEVGCIYSDNQDEAKIAAWKERRPIQERCRKCAHYPLCVRLKKCNAYPEECNDLVIGKKDMYLQDKIINTYEKWKGAGGE